VLFARVSASGARREREAHKMQILLERLKRRRRHETPKAAPPDKIRELCLESVVIECECGERLVLIGRMEDWLSCAPIECGGCGEKLLMW
jgi:hypothetical protein